MTYNPWQDAAQRYPHVHIEWADVAPAHAVWAPTEDVVLIGRHLTKAERRFALAHELAHMDVGDRAADACWFATRQETAADKLATRRLITIGDLCRVVRTYQDTREAAAELDVPLAALVLRGATLHPAERGLVNQVLSRREAVA